MQLIRRLLCLPKRIQRCRLLNFGNWNHCCHLLELRYQRQLCACIGCCRQEGGWQVRLQRPWFEACRVRVARICIASHTIQLVDTGGLDHKAGLVPLQDFSNVKFAARDSASHVLTFFSSERAAPLHFDFLCWDLLQRHGSP